MQGEEDGQFEGCPLCNSPDFITIKDWANLHEKEVLAHCCDCDAIFIIYYKFVKMVRLVPKEASE